MNALMDVHEEVAQALASGGAVVALESTLISHGLPWPQNLACASAAEAAIRAAGATPATVAVIDGRVRVGLATEALTALARTAGVRKVSRRDLAVVVARGETGATTVAATMIVAAAAGIEVFATGGIGGVHRGGADSLDISADLTELARTPVTVVSAGPKVILDLPRTLEVLETYGVPVLGYRTDTLPGFFTGDTGLPVDQRADSPEALAAIVHTQRQLGLASGIVVANPPPPHLAIAMADLERWLATADARALQDSITGKALTPYLLAELAELSGGRTLALNVALIEANATLAARLSVALRRAR